MGRKTLKPSFLIRIQRHFPVNRRKASPAAIGRISCVAPSFFLFKAVREPPAMNLAIPAGASPATRMLITALREAHMGVGRGTSATSMRCCIRRPDGPLAYYYYYYYFLFFYNNNNEIHETRQYTNGINAHTELLLMLSLIYYYYYYYLKCIHN